MVIIEGEAKTLGNLERLVKKGDVVTKLSKEPHGFSDIHKPFSFISISYDDGIMKSLTGWDMDYL